MGEAEATKGAAGPGAEPAARAALRAWDLAGAALAPLGAGLIHASFAVDAAGARYVLQRVSPIFSPAVQENIDAVTRHLERHGVATFRLVPTASGELSHVDERGDRWRLLVRLTGVSFDVCEGPAQARSAGAAVGRFHAALLDLPVPLAPTGIPGHDPARHLAALREAVEAGHGHRLYDDVAPLADEIFAAARAWTPLGDLPERVIHGDLKLNNVLFAGPEPPERDRAVALIDLDTVARRPLWMELGDAWRSWTNRRGEDAPEAELDLDLLRAAWEGWREAFPEPLAEAERASLLEGLERVALELAARFAADALRESYFGWDPERFPTRGDHNLVRARGQLSLHRQARATRGARARLLGLGD